MKKRLYCYVLLIPCLLTAVAQAFLPPLPLPLAERVKMSSHIFVGEIRDVHFISGSGKIISPRQAGYLMNRFGLQPWVETKIRVLEPLLWSSGKPAQFLLFRYRIPIAGYFQPKDRANGLKEMLTQSKEEVGKKFMFLTDVVAQKGRRTYFVSNSYPAREEMKEKAAVQEAIKRLKKATVKSRSSASSRTGAAVESEREIEKSG